MFENRLQAGESILWEGKPNLKNALQRKRNRLLLFFGGVILGMVLFLFGTYLGNDSHSKMNLFMILGLFLIFGLFVWFGVFMVALNQPIHQFRKACYALTNRRILIQNRERAQEFDLRDIKTVRQVLADKTQALVLFDREYDVPLVTHNGYPSAGVIYYAGRANASSYRMGIALGLSNHPINSPGALAILYALDDAEKLEDTIQQLQKSLSRTQRNC